jgi:hypothetical protein
MSGLGRFLEFSVRTPDILDSLGYYRLLGFSELEIGDAWAHKYAVVSDGSLCIGLHEREFDAPAMSFVQQDLARRARRMTDHGFEFSFSRLDEDVFNELGLGDRDGNMIRMLEARTFSGADDSVGDSICGSFFELSLPVKDALRAARFWGPVAPAVLSLREEPTTHMRFDVGGAPVGLSESIALEAPSPCFRCNDREALQSLLDRESLQHALFPGYEGALAALRTPEGTMLYVFDEDFLGEGYEVTESYDPADIPPELREA